MTDPQSVRAAAERIKGAIGFYPEEQEDAYLLATFAISHLDQADGGEPVTPEDFMRIGCICGDVNTYYPSLAGQFKRVHNGGDSFTWRWEVDGITLARFSTRCQFRKLCSALGIQPRGEEVKRGK